jgi:hypothetical protein
VLRFDRVRRASLLLVVAGLFSCTFDIPDVARDGGAGQDASIGTDAPPDGFVFPRDAAPDGPAGTVYNDITDKNNWTVFDTSSVTGGGNVQSYSGGAFDGRYVYFSPTSGNPASSEVLQLDTMAAKGFGDSSAWAHFDTMAVSTAAGGFWGAAYDGNEFVYFTPFTTSQSAMSAADGLLTRYDSKAPYTMAGSWAGYNATSVNMGAQGFSGEAFDGQYIYFAPDFAGSSAASSLVARFDTKLGFAGGSSSWLFFDAVQISPLTAGFIGAVFDGRYVTFVPNATTVALQYDTQAGSFLNTTSWQSLNLATLPGGSTQLAYAGGVYDGTYVYLVPEYYANGTTDTFGSLVARYDPSQGFGASAWSTFDVAAVNPYARGFGGGAFDGRYVYLVPEANTGTTMATGAQVVGNGLVVRYDTTRPFDAPSSWSTFDLKANFGTTVAAFFGAVFDGRYLYLVPYGTTNVARFDARTPSAMPALPAFHGSFF